MNCAGPGYSAIRVHEHRRAGRTPRPGFCPPSAQCHLAAHGGVHLGQQGGGIGQKLPPARWRRRQARPDSPPRRRPEPTRSFTGQPNSMKPSHSWESWGSVLLSPRRGQRTAAPQILRRSGCPAGAFCEEAHIAVGDHRQLGRLGQDRPDARGPPGEQAALNPNIVSRRSGPP